MKLPKRVPQHISETASFKIFSSKVPNNWIIRDVTERDYGIDCYLEIVNQNNELTGDLALIQLKSRQSILWTKENKFTLSKIDIATTNYWYSFPVPVFIFLVDINRNELYYLPIGNYIKTHYLDFNKQKIFNYKVEKRNLFGMFTFRLYYIRELYRNRFESEFLFFLSNLEHYQKFQLGHENLDFHLGVERTDLIFFEVMHRNYEFLASYFDIRHPIPEIFKIKEKSREMFSTGYYELYEYDLSIWGKEFQKLTLQIIKKIKAFLENEKSYWLITNRTVYNYAIQIKEDGQLPY